MTPEDFENLLNSTRAELVKNFKHGETTELDVSSKLIIDYQERVAQLLFEKFHSLELQLTKMKGDIIVDNTDRFKLIMEELRNQKS